MALSSTVISPCVGADRGLPTREDVELVDYKVAHS